MGQQFHDQPSTSFHLLDADQIHARLNQVARETSAEASSTPSTGSSTASAMTENPDYHRAINQRLENVTSSPSAESESQPNGTQDPNREPISPLAENSAKDLLAAPMTSVNLD